MRRSPDVKPKLSIAALGFAAFVSICASPLPLFRAQEKVSLIFGPAAGTELIYTVGSLVNVDGKSFLGKDLALNADARGEIRLRALPGARDIVRADLVSPGIEVNARLPDRVVSQTLATSDGQPLQVVFNRTGKVESIHNPEVLGPESVFNISLPQNLRDYFPAFPVHPVGPGDGWTESRRLNIPFQGLDLEVNLEISYALGDILPGPDGRKAFVSALYTVGISGSRDLGETAGVFEGGGTGTGYVHFLVDRGWFSEYRLDFKADAVFVMKKGAERLLEWPFTFSVFAEVILLNVLPPIKIGFTRN
ncbi:MAG: hypothetical protein QHH14_12175 [Clostridiales bacterium]|jgi:hypothetical protein|nr:hypothetical protein [Clostridiales bacterium]